MCLKRDFEPFKQLYFAYFCAGLFLFSILLTRLDEPDFSPRLLLIGTLGSIVNIVGLSMINKAITLGPIGAVSALTNLSTVMFSIVTAVRLMVMPQPLELVGMAIGLLGACILTIPQ